MGRFFGTKFRERRPRLTRLCVVKHSVALTESAATGILPAQTDTRAFERKRTERHRFSEGPVKRRSALAHLRTARELPHHLGIQIEALRHDGNLLRDSFDNFRRD